MLSLLKNALKSVSTGWSQFFDLIMPEELSFKTDTDFYHMGTFPGINLGYSGGPAVLVLS